MGFSHKPSSSWGTPYGPMAYGHGPQHVSERHRRASQISTSPMPPSPGQASPGGFIDEDPGRPGFEPGATRTKWRFQWGVSQKWRFFGEESCASRWFGGSKYFGKPPNWLAHGWLFHIWQWFWPIPMRRRKHTKIHWLRVSWNKWGQHKHNISTTQRYYVRRLCFKHVQIGRLMFSRRVKQLIQSPLNHQPESRLTHRKTTCIKYIGNMPCCVPIPWKVATGIFKHRWKYFLREGLKDCHA